MNPDEIVLNFNPGTLVILNVGAAGVSRRSPRR
jgi:hypothetical protein